MKHNQHSQLADDLGLSSAGSLKLLIIDEAQDLYRPGRKADMLWTIVKILGQGAGRGFVQGRLRILLAVLYGVRPSGMSTPVPATDLQYLNQQEVRKQLGQAAGEPRSAQSSSSPLASPMTFGVQNSVLLHRQSDSEAPQLALAFSPEDISSVMAKLAEQVNVGVPLFDKQELFDVLHQVSSGLVGYDTVLSDLW